MNVTLPNGVTIEDAPEDITQSELARIAIRNNLATEEDFVGLGLFGEPVQEEEDEPSYLEAFEEGVRRIPGEAASGFARMYTGAGQYLAEAYGEE